MKASIIIPVYNGEKRIKNLMKALSKQVFKDFEVIVVNDGSTDETLRALRSGEPHFEKFRVVEQENGGRAKSRNAGVRIAEGELLVFFDDDMSPQPNSVEKHVRFHEKHTDAILVGAQLEDEALTKTDFQKYKAYLSRKWLKDIPSEYPMTRENLFLTAANFSIRKDLFDRLGGFDERLYDAEDWDLAMRAFKEKVSIYFDKENIAWHDDFLTCRSFIKRQREYTAAIDKLQDMKPDLIRDFNRGACPKLSHGRKLVFWFFSSFFWIRMIDVFNWLRILPRPLRYKIYDLVVTSIGSVYVKKGI